MDREKRIQELRKRLQYIEDIFGPKENANVSLLRSKLDDFIREEPGLSHQEAQRLLASLEELFAFLEGKLERELTPMTKVRIVRHPQRICLKDILEHVYDNYTEIGGQDEYSIDPAMLIARAYIARRVGNKVYNQPVMVIGQEKGHGQEFRNGGSVKPWGNAKALHYMKVAETENIPIHTYVFTPGAYPVEDYPGAAQQIAKNLYEMAGLRVPIVSVISEGGSGGAEAIALADIRLMLSHGYYSVISPEGAAAIEGRLRGGERASLDLIDKCASALRITALDNKAMGYVDHVISEPPLGARPDHYDFFKSLRHHVIKATDELVLSVRGVSGLRALALRRRRDTSGLYIRWILNSAAKDRLVWRRYKKFRAMAQQAFLDRRSKWLRCYDVCYDTAWGLYSFFRYDVLRKHQRKISQLAEEVQAEVHLVVDRSRKYWEGLRKILPGRKQEDQGNELTSLSCWKDGTCGNEDGWEYVSPQAKEDRAVSCPNAHAHGCQDQWAPDLFGEWAGVCNCCGHHFPMEYQWYLYNVFDPGSIYEFNALIESANPLDYEGLDIKLDQAKKKTGHKSGCMTFEARVNGLTLYVAMLMAPFRGGSVGAAEGEKFIRAIDQARRRHLPFIAYVHGTAGIRIQEGTNGVIQMPRCTLAVRRYMESGGLYLVLYDTNSYAGPVASFLGCSPYQFAIRSSNIGFAGPGVIKETTSMDIPPDYHKAYRALSRGHIQGIWDRREIRNNLHQALQTMGGRNLYYR
ncbi:MAG: acetyl-CoA carboxylase carboxyl transferase subunit alpha/beta [Deltaproteobacteria bacterium]|nr:acetyl-CoA carboxylase carboxyl transferase subunit alpha/beta [Deltaproteobacteria bacterium]